MSFRRAARKDENHTQIVKAFRDLGYSVLDVAQLKNCCDIVVAKNLKTIAVEIKDGDKPPSARKLSKGETEFMENWRGKWALIESVNDVIELDKLA